MSVLTADNLLTIITDTKCKAISVKINITLLKINKIKRKRMSYQMLRERNQKEIKKSDKWNKKILLRELFAWKI